MKGVWKQLISLVLSVAMTAGVMCIPVYAEEVENVETNTVLETLDSSEIAMIEDEQIVTESEIAVETEVETESETVVETEVETESETVVETEVETESETVVETEVETEPETEMESESETEIEIESEEVLEPLLLSSKSLKESENNNSMSKADKLSVGYDIGGTISSKDDYDYFKISLPSAGRLNLNVNAYLKYHYITIYNSSGKEIWDTGWIEWNSTTEKSFKEHHIDLIKGTYYILIQADTGGFKVGSYNIQALFNGSMETYAEPNNSMGQAKGVGFKTKIRGQLAENDLKDYFRLVLPSSGRIKFNILSYIQNYVVDIYDSNGEVVWDSYSNSWNSNTKSSNKNHFIDLTKGTYYIVFSAYDYGFSQYYTGNYNFTIYFTASQETYAEPNNSMGQAKGVGFKNKIRGQLALNDSMDFYRMVVPSAGRVKINILSYMEYYSVYLYDVSGNKVWSSVGNYVNKNTGYRVDNYTIDLIKGTYYIVFSEYDYSYYRYTGNYNFTTYFTPSQETYAEPNNVMAQAKGVGIGSKTRGQLAVNDDKDYYRLKLPSACDIKINVMAYLQDYDLYIYSSSGSEIYSSTYNPWNSKLGYSNTGHYVYLPKGTYYIQFVRNSAFNGSIYTGNYNFTVSK